MAIFRLILGASLLVLNGRMVIAASNDILPGADLKGWTRIPIPPTDGLKPNLQWRVEPEQGAVVCAGTGQHEWLRYDVPVTDFVFEVDWRFTPKGDVKYNSGIGVRLSQYGEIWAQAQTGPTGGYLFGQNLVEGALERFNLLKQMKENRVKPAGEWNHYEIRAQGDRISLYVNGAMVSEIAGYALRKGYVGLEAEGHEITFRNLKLRPLN
jgi:hypothetical protein